MFKKLLLPLVFALFAFATYGQTIVSTSPENKNVVLEEFTGIHCTYCPDGHAIAKAIQDAHPDDVSLINIHTGGYATPGPGEPDFRTPYGAAIAGQSGLTGYPSGTVNRHVFPGRGMTSGGTAMGRGSWTISANETLALSSDVNVAVEAEIDVQTNEMTVHVEAYYTANSPESTNLLNVALLQNNTKGPQTGGGMGDEYVHMHRLVELITGQWGETINTTTAGTFVDKTYTYTIPADYNGVPTELADMEVVAFITNTHQELPSGNRAYPTYTGIANADDAYVRSIEDIVTTCNTTSIAPVVEIQNLGQNTINSLDIEYTINGDAHTYTWTGELPALHTVTVDLPDTGFTMQPTNTLVVSVPNDDDNSNNEDTLSFDDVPHGTKDVTMVLQTDGYGNETFWRLKNSAGQTIYHGGPYGNNETITETFDLDADCYSFKLIDSYGDGGAIATLTDNQGNVVFNEGPDFGNQISRQFTSNGQLGVEDQELQGISIYPNPASTVLNVKNAENANIQVYNILGQEVMAKTGIAMDEQLNVSNFQAGTYFIKIAKDSQVTTKRFIVSN
jgi:hypothetical protein